MKALLAGIAILVLAILGLVAKVAVPALVLSCVAWAFGFDFVTAFQFFLVGILVVLVAAALLISSAALR